MKTLKLVMCLIVFIGSANASVEKVFARATKFHKSDNGCDPWTKKGLTATKIRLRDNCDDTIGMVAVDPQRIPYGSLIYSPQNKRFYLACNRGGAVSARTAAKKLANKKGLSQKYRNALVLDFYAPREIIDNHFDYFLVIEHEGENFRFGLSKTEQNERLDPNFWLGRAVGLLNVEEEFNSELEEIIDRLRQMSKDQKKSS